MVTTRMRRVSLTPPCVAVIVAAPFVSPRASPVTSIDSTVVLSLVHAGLTLTVDGNVVTFNVPSFAARADGERLSGAFTVDVTAASLSGKGHLEAELQSVTRAAAVIAPAGDASSSSFGSWRELLQVIKRRR